MRWKQFFGMMSDARRKEAAAALKSVNEQTGQADANQQTQAVVISAHEMRKSTAKMHADQAKAQAERYADERNTELRKRAGGVL